MDRKVKKLCKLIEADTNDKIKSSLEYAYLKHKNQKRKDGSEYIFHPIRVANNVIKYERECDEKHVSAALLHDTIEDTDATYEDISSRFGMGVADLVKELTNDEDMKHKIGKTEYLKEKMLNMDKEALLIKLCDRLDNVTDLANSPDDFKKKYIMETEEIIKSLLENKNLSEIDLNIIKDICYKLVEIDKNINCLKYKFKNIKV